VDKAPKKEPVNSAARDTFDGSQSENLSGPFRNLLSEYVDESYRAHEVPAGEHHGAASQLPVALQDDWRVFSSVIIRKKNAAKLLDQILAVNSNGEDLNSESWVLRFSLQAIRTEWGFLDRMFPSDYIRSSTPYETVQEQLRIPGTLENQVRGHLSYFAVLVEEGTLLFRARRGCETTPSKPVPHHDLGPNPAHPASRANAKTQYAMYLAEAEHTAVSEIRQQVGSMVSVGEFAVNRDLTVVDLCLSIAPPNPFVTKNLSWILDLTLLLRGIAGLMSKPAQTREDYFRTQLLANIARAIGYDGVRYPSALNPADRNLVLFAPDAVRLQASWVNLINDLSFRRI
jgi:hypothetical protein